MTNLPDRETAERLAERLVGLRLAACASVLAPCRSIYHWQGGIESADETPLLVKARAECYKDVERVILELHPYELPEIIQVPITGGLPAYLDWVENETK